jgi:hypothetical protein
MMQFAALRAFRARNVFNPWADSDPLDEAARGHTGSTGPDARLARLADHFRVSPALVLLGEASGYQGCHFSGIPFTNEKLILEGRIPRVTVAGRLTRRERPGASPRQPSSGVRCAISALQTVWCSGMPLHGTRSGPASVIRTARRPVMSSWPAARSLRRRSTLSRGRRLSQWARWHSVRFESSVVSPMRSCGIRRWEEHSSFGPASLQSLGSWGCARVHEHIADDQDLHRPRHRSYAPMIVGRRRVPLISVSKVPVLSLGNYSG